MTQVWPALASAPYMSLWLGAFGALWNASPPSCESGFNISYRTDMKRDHGMPETSILELP